MGTKDRTLVRRSSVTTGNTDWESSRTTEWEVKPKNTYHNLLCHKQDGFQDLCPDADLTDACEGTGLPDVTDLTIKEVHELVGTPTDGDCSSFKWKHAGIRAR